MFEISVVGCGPGDKAFLTEAASKEVHSADYLIGPRPLLDLFSNVKAKVFKLIPSENKIDTIVGDTQSGKYKGRIVFLTEGDPGIMSVAPLLIENFGQKVLIIPGVSLIQIAFARLGIGWFGTVMAKAQTSNFRTNRSQVLKSGKLFVYLGGASCFEEVLRFFNSLGDNWRMFVFENLTLADEKIYEVKHEDKYIQVTDKAVVIVFDGSEASTVFDS